MSTCLDCGRECCVAGRSCPADDSCHGGKDCAVARLLGRAACVERSGGVCELISDLTKDPRSSVGPLEMDHFYGRASESVGACWMLCRECHRMKTENRPSRAAWDGWFKEHCARHGYAFKGRLIHAPRAGAE